MTSSLPVAFVAGFDGTWRIDGISARVGDALPPAARLTVVEGEEAESADGRWVLRGTPEEEAGTSPLALGRPEARCAVMIALRRSPAGREASADEGAHRLLAGVDHPGIASRLHRGGPEEPFDVLAWFEYAPADEDAFTEMVAGLRASDEWPDTEREIDIRLVR